MKKFLCTFLVLIFLCAGIFSAGCAETESAKFKRLDKLLSPEDPVTLSYWHYYNQGPLERIKEIVDEFNETVGALRGIWVDQQSLNNPGNIAAEIAKIINGQITEKTMPDLFQTYTDTAFGVNEKRGLADVEYYLTSAERAEYVDSYFEEGKMGAGGSKIFPVAKSTEVLVLSKNQWDIFEAAVPGVSLDDLATYEGITEVAGLYYDWCGKAFFGRDSFANMMVIGLKQQGEDIVSLAGDAPAVSQNRAAYRKIWDNMYVPYMKGHFTGLSSSRSNDMGSGDIIAYIGSSSSASYIPQQIIETGKEPVANDVMILPSPHFEGTPKIAVQQGAGVAITKSTAKREYASAVFLKWLTEAERNIEFAASTGYMPVKKAGQSLSSILDFINDSDLYKEKPGDTEKVKNDKAHTKNMISKIQAVTFVMKEEYTFFAAKGYKNGAVIRDNLFETKTFTADAAYKQSMIYKYATDFEVVKAGTKTLDSFLNDANFDEWYSKFITAVSTEIATK